jgi:hypothetical protein
VSRNIERVQALRIVSLSVKGAFVTPTRSNIRNTSKTKPAAAETSHLFKISCNPPFYHRRPKNVESLLAKTSSIDLKGKKVAGFDSTPDTREGLN